MASLTVENYVKAVHQLCARHDGQAASTGRIAEILNVSPGTVTSMLKTLNESKLATHTPYEGARLTEAGTALALRVVRRHRLIEEFLVKTLGLTWDEVHEEAEHMEHAVSDLLVDRIDQYLDFPDFDPHGDPIPKPDGSMEPSSNRSLADCKVGEDFCLARVLDQSPEFLRFLSSTGLPLGAKGEVLTNGLEAGIVTVRSSGEEMTLGREAAKKLLVK